MRSDFPILEHHPAYFNHAAIGPWPRRTAEAAQAFAAENMRQGSNGFWSWVERENELRGMLAQLVGANSCDDIALLKNTTEAISAVAWGLDLEAGDNLVIPSDEFPSNRLPWVAQTSRGAEIREVDLRTANDAEQALIDAMDRNTRILSVSSVQWNDGFRLDLERLGSACRERGVLFFVDAIQQLGALPVDVEACHIDFLAADAHKWLLAPEGIAVFYCRESVRPLLRLLQQGWHMVDRPWNFDRTEWIPSDTARRFEAGSPNSLGQAALHASVGLLMEEGLERVAGRILENTQSLMESLAALPGYAVVSRTDTKRRSGIVAFRHESLDSGVIYRELQRSGISSALRGGALRISPHFYQGEKELELLVETLAHIV
jgi:cysteine desulfurase/selenocysteine lyase